MKCPNGVSGNPSHVREGEIRKCIYCLEDKALSAFNVEHVIPRAFGSFQKNLTIHCVCRDCNGYFGNKLELVFARDSIEALRRLQFGLKPPEDVSDLRYERLGFAIGAEGEWKGVRLEYVFEQDEWLVGLVPQVGFRKKDGSGWTYLTERDLADSRKGIPNDVDPRTGIRIISPNESVEGRLVDLLKKRGIPFHKKGDLPPPPSIDGHVLTEGSFRIDPIVRRCVAKIAFNYAARAEWAEEAEFVLYPDFNVTRSFIRDGVQPGYPLVVPGQSPILADDFTTRRQTDGHMITLDWAVTGKDIVSQVSFFNEITYKVSLARDFTGVWRNVRTGHHFDITSRTISRLIGTRLTPG